MHLYGMDVVHRDIKPENIMISKCSGNAVYKLGDFEAARVLNRGQKYGSLYGTFEYMHPDVYAKFYGTALAKKSSLNEFGYEHELWPIGISLYEMATGQLPFRTPNGRDDVAQMYNMTSTKNEDVISINGDGTPEYYLPESCEIENKSNVTNLLAGLLRTTNMWSMEKFGAQMKQISSQTTKKRSHTHTQRKSKSVQIQTSQGFTPKSKRIKMENW